MAIALKRRFQGELKWEQQYFTKKDRGSHGCNLDTQTVKGTLLEKVYFFKAAENFLYKDERTEELDGIKVTIYVDQVVLS